MTWQARVESDPIKDELSTTCTILYFGPGKDRKTYSGQLDDDSLKAIVRAEIARLDGVAASVGKLTYRAGDLIDITVAPPPVPTPEQLAQAKFESDYAELHRWNQAVLDGVESPDEPRIAELKTSIKAAWKREYRGLI